VFGSRLALAESYAHLLAAAGTERGLIGPREVPRLWERHLLNCAVVADLVPQGARVADVGSGAGLPGIAMALRRPDLDVTLIEPLLRRVKFLEEAVTTLGLDRVTVVRSRAEDLAGELAFDVVTARAVAPLAKLLSWTLPLLSPGGTVLAMKGQSVHEEIASLPLSRQAEALVTVLSVEIGEFVEPTTVVRVESALAGHIPWSRSRGDTKRSHPGSSHRHRR
jgi:16S rRNA (guanine527-N7)-methyltransferase